MPHKYTIGVAICVFFMLFLLGVGKAESAETTHKIRACLPQGCATIQIKCKPTKNKKRSYCWTHVDNYILEQLDK